MKNKGYSYKIVIQMYEEREENRMGNIFFVCPCKTEKTVAGAGIIYNKILK